MAVDAGWLKEAVMNWKEIPFTVGIPDAEKAKILCLMI